MCPSIPSYELLVELHDNRRTPEQTARVEQMRHLEPQLNSQTYRQLTVADDLHWVADSGILLSHWRPFISEMLGNYTRLQPTTSTTNMEFN